MPRQDGFAGGLCGQRALDLIVANKGTRVAHSGSPFGLLEDAAPAVAAERPWLRPNQIAQSYHFPVFGIDFHGSWGGSGAPFCRSSIDCLSGERTNAIMPSRGGRLMVTPPFIKRSHVA